MVEYPYVPRHSIPLNGKAYLPWHDIAQNEESTLPWLSSIQNKETHHDTQLHKLKALT